MGHLCDDLPLFMDGDLPAARAELFRQHLPDCASCQRAFADALRTELLTAPPRQEDPARVTGAPPPRRIPRWLPPVAVGASLLAVLLVLLSTVSRQDAIPTEDTWLAEAPKRQLPARLSHPEARRYRPLRNTPMGASTASTELPYASLGALQRKGDRQGQATVILLRGAPGEAQRALDLLEPLDASPEVDSDRAAALLIMGEFEAALARADAALSVRPGYSPALWNRALALVELGLPGFALQNFEEVANQEEAGWADEARDRARHLREQMAKSQSRWNDVQEEGARLAQPGPHSLSSEARQSPSTRMHFYIAVWSAPTRERVLELRSVARDLDAQATGRILETYVERVAALDFTRRGPLVQKYLALEDAVSPAPQQEELRASVRASRGNEDLLVGMLLRLNATKHHLDTFTQAARALKDPWFDLLVAQERGKAEVAAGHFDQAAHVLREAHTRCPAPGLEYRCMWLQLELSNLFLQRSQPEEARDYATSGWQSARQFNEWWLEGSLLWNLAQVARYMNDSALARARYGEYLARDAKQLPDISRRVHQHLADVALHELQVDEARRELRAALATRLPLSFSGAFTLADLSRLSPEPEDATHLERALKEAEPQLTPGARVIATHIRGRFLLARAPAQGRALLERAIEESTQPALAEDPGAARARTYSYTSLLMDAGHQGNFTQALEWSERERGLGLPRMCMLLASADSERTLFIARGTSGQVVGDYDDSRRRPLPEGSLRGVVPEGVLAPLRACPQVEVLARPPLHGRPGLLPDDMAWSYLLRTTTERPSPPMRGRHLAVHAVETPREYKLPRFNPWEPSFTAQEERIELTGSAATPERVLAEMREATEIDLMVHGKNAGSLEASSLVLAAGNKGAELHARDVRATPLKGAPFTVLAACQGAATAYSALEPLNLPAAFMKAGARGVLAATEEILDREAMSVFTTIRERIRQGDTPAIALRDERQRWLRDNPNSKWIHSVLLFE